MLFRLQRGKLLEFGGSESDLSSVCSTDIEALRHDDVKKEDFVHQFTNWKARSSFDKKLVLGIMHRKGHKNFEEQEEEIDYKSEDSHGSSDKSVMVSNRNLSSRKNFKGKDSNGMSRVSEGKQVSLSHNMKSGDLLCV
jgi:hypothetical protein